jgi:hypothetical protein
VLLRRWLSVLVIAAAASTAAIRPAYAPAPDIRVDGLGYHAWVPALLRGDLSFCGDPGLVESGATPPAPNAAGNCPLKYPPGVALVQLPVMAPLALANDRSFDPSQLENTASKWLGVAALVAMSVLLVATCRRLRVADWATHVSVLALVFGTGLFHYATFDSSFSHIYVALLFAALAYVGVRAAAASTTPPRSLVVLLSFLIVETREVSVIGVVCLGALWVAVARSRDPDHVWFRDSTMWSGVIGVTLAVLVEAAYATYAQGTLSLAAYGTEDLKLGRLNELHVLAGYDHGVFTWYPIIAVVLVAALAGVITRAAGLALLAGVVGSTVLYGSWHDWRLGGGFGHRGFLDLAPGAAVILAVALDRASPARRRHVLLAVPAAATVTLELMAGYWRHTIPFAYTTSSQYWAHVADRPLAAVVALTALGAVLTRPREPQDALGVSADAAR